MVMDYFKIGQAVRKYRQAQGMTQEELAERIGISTTHMSHIETGNTKLSLPVLVSLAVALNVRTDSILFECPPSKVQTSEEFQSLIAECTETKLMIIPETVKSLKIALRKHL